MDAATLLVVTSEPDVLDDALRWSAAVGVAPEVAHDVVAARRSWTSAAAVLVSAELAAPLARTAPPRRDGVVVLAGGPGPHPDAVWRHALHLGAVEVLGRHDGATVLDRLGTLLDGRGEAACLAVVGAVGGAGASTLATATALESARRGLRPVLVDADARGAGVDLVLGAERVEGVRWSGLGGADGHVGATRLARQLPARDGVAVLACPRDGADVPVEVVPDVLTAATRAFDVVVADVPRHLDPLAAGVLTRCAGVVLLVPEDVRCVAAARLVLPRLAEHVPRVLLATARRRGGLGAGAVADALQLPVVARVGPDRRLRADVDHGRGPGRSRTLRTAAGRVLDVLGLVAAGRGR
jgi:secretion/DNA translocation related CpaE-like protein